MSYRNESIFLFLNPDGSFRDGQVNRVEVLTNGREIAANPRTLDAEDMAGVLEGLNGDLLSQRDALAAQVAALTLERDNALGLVAPLQTQVAALQAQLDAINNPPGPDLSTVDGAKQFITARRYENETAGFSVGGQFISTERDEIGHWFPRYFNAHQWTIGDAATRAGNPAGLYPFKPKNHNPTILTAAQVLRVYDCMTWFINSCFAVEAAAYARLDAGDAIADVIASIEWPQSSFDWQPPAA